MTFVVDDDGETTCHVVANPADGSECVPFRVTADGDGYRVALRMLPYEKGVFDTFATCATVDGVADEIATVAGRVISDRAAERDACAYRVSEAVRERVGGAFAVAAGWESMGGRCTAMVVRVAPFRPNPSGGFLTADLGGDDAAAYYVTDHDMGAPSYACPPAMVSRYGGASLEVDGEGMAAAVIASAALFGGVR